MLPLYDFYQDMKQKRILFSYCGPIDQASIEGVGSTLRRNLELESADHTARMSVFSIFVEQVQNILNYSEDKLGPEAELENELRVGIVVIAREESGDYSIYCGNRIYTADAPRIDEWLSHLGRLTKEELKQLYKERRRMAPEPGSKGAGLGLIEMARKAGRPIEHSFTAVDGVYSFFTLKVVVGRQV